MIQASTAARALEARWLGSLPYADGLALQKKLVAQRRAGLIPDQLILLEHPHVITLGSSSHQENVLIDDADRALLGIELFQSGRGGDVTYHGPGQLVGYPIFDLKPDRCDVHRYVRDIEDALMRALRTFALMPARKTGLTGVWIGEEKIAAIGVRVSSGWITSHGFALNVNTQLSFFDAIVPCGIRDHGVTSMQRALAHDVAMSDVCSAVIHAFTEVFDLSCAHAEQTLGCQVRE